MSTSGSDRRAAFLTYQLVRGAWTWGKSRVADLPSSHASYGVACGSYSNRAFSGRVMRFNKGIAANTTSVDRASPPSMVR